jgi:hypothetical protein
MLDACDVLILLWIVHDLDYLLRRLGRTANQKISDSKNPITRPMLK